MTRTRFGLIYGFLVLGAVTTQASVSTFSDHTSWVSAAGGGTGDIVDALDSGSLDRGSFAFSGSALGFFPNANPQTSINGSGYFRAFLEGSSTNDVTFTFDSPILALGYDLNPQNFNLGALVQIAIDGVAAGSYALPGTDINGFFGIVSDDPFTVLRLTTAATEAWHGIDNVEAFNAVAVPEPGVTGMVIMGLVCLQLARRHSCIK